LIEFPQYINLSEKYIRAKISEFLAEDLPNGDVTTDSIIPETEYITAKIQALEKLTFAGAIIIPHCFGSKCQMNVFKSDGEVVESGEILGKIHGPAQTILSCERVMLNLIQRLSGIASASRKYVQLAKAYDVKILDTRKTTPGLRLFEKYAVTVGGAYNHRLNLSEGILIKDNHLSSTRTVSDALKAVKGLNPHLPVELEVDNFDQIYEALIIGVDGFLLDNMSPDFIKEAVKIIRNSEGGSNIFIEASGGINDENIISYLETGVHAISIGAITHGAISKNINLELTS
jgi:nicotinate-nucleotide pyrophosphorylase (carboxylating)